MLIIFLAFSSRETWKQIFVWIPQTADLIKMPHFGSNGSFTFYNRTHNNVASRAKLSSSALQTLKDIKSHQISLRTRGKEKVLAEMGEKICKESNKPNIVQTVVDGVDLKKLRCVEYPSDSVRVNSVQTNSSQKIKSLCKNVEMISKIHQKTWNQEAGDILAYWPGRSSSNWQFVPREIFYQNRLVWYSAGCW